MRAEDRKRVTVNTIGSTNAEMCHANKVSGRGGERDEVCWGETTYKRGREREKVSERNESTFAAVD